MGEELKVKPCPFCGKPASIVDVKQFGSAPDGIRIMCATGGCLSRVIARGPWYHPDTEEGVKAWSNRPIESALENQVDERDLLLNLKRKELTVAKERIAELEGALERQNKKVGDLLVKVDNAHDEIP